HRPDADVRPAGQRGARLAATAARTSGARPLAAARLAHALLPAGRLRRRSRRDRGRAAPGADAHVEGGRRVDAAPPATAGSARLSPGPLAPGRRRPVVDAGERDGRCSLPTAWDLFVALWANAVLAAHALEARELEHRHPGRRDAIPGCARDGDRRGSGAAGLAGAAPRRPR